MNKMLIRSTLLSLVALTSYAQEINVSSLRFINELTIDYNKPFKETKIGGLSGIDYDPSSQVYYLISDEENATFYTAKIFISQRGIDSIKFLTAGSFIQTRLSTQGVDPESIRFNKQTNQLVWTSEGERNAKEKILIRPSINIADRDGKFVGNFSVPSNLTMQLSDKGTRNNGTLEGISYGDNFKTLYASMEEPLYEDGPRASLTAGNSWVRFYKFDAKTKENIGQYAYKLEPIAHPSNPDDAFKMDGVSEILFFGSSKLLVVERSYSTGHAGCTVKVFTADLSLASNIKDNPSLKVNPPSKPIEKKLLLNMDELGIYIDNIEGVTFGPDLPNGHKSLIFVSDNNFQEIQKTQILLFEVIP